MRAGIVFAVAVTLAALTALGCRSPTQIAVDVNTNVRCTQYKGVTITVGRLGEIEDKTPIVITGADTCVGSAELTRLGSLVITPSGSKDEEVAIKVVVGVTGAASLCTKPDYKGCIVARRALRFVPHEPLDLPMKMSVGCLDQPCTPDQTCVDGFGCVPATIQDSTQCKGSGCDDRLLAQGLTPSDGGVDGGVDGTLGDAGPDAPEAVVDADVGPPIPGHVKQLSLGTDHACALLEDGNIKCWGDNTIRQLNDGTIVSRSRPVASGGIGFVTQMSAGDSFTCGVLKDHTIRCWGQNEYRECGFPQSFGGSPPGQVERLTNAVQVHAGFRHACALTTDSEVWCWGDSSDGALGNGSTTAGLLAPTKITSLSGVVQIASTCARNKSGEVWCWGNGHPTPAKFPGIAGKLALNVHDDYADGSVVVVLGDGSVVQARRNATGFIGTTATPVAAPGAVQHVVGHSGETYELLNDGSVWALDALDDTTPSAVVGLGVGTVDAIASGNSLIFGQGFQCALLKSGEVRCWGDDYLGQIGIGQPSVFVTPQRLKSLSGVKLLRRIDGGTTGGGVGAIHTDGSISAWGKMAALGVDRIATPRSLPLGADNMDLSVGRNLDFAFLLKTSHALRGRFAGSPEPTPHLAAKFVDFERAIVSKNWEMGWRTTGDLVFYAIDSDANKAGIFGVGTPGAVVDSVTTLTLPKAPLGVVGHGDSFGPGNETLCAWLVDGTVRCWGDNQRGLAGTLTGSEDVLAPNKIVFPAPVPSIDTMSMSLRHACAVGKDNQVYCWGDNGSGQLGVASPPTGPTTPCGCLESRPRSASRAGIRRPARGSPTRR